MVFRGPSGDHHNDVTEIQEGSRDLSGLGNRGSRKYRERGGMKAKRAGSGGEGLGLIPAEG